VMSEHADFHRTFPTFSKWYDNYSNCYAYALGDAQLLITRTLGGCLPGVLHGPQPVRTDRNFAAWCTPEVITRMAELDGLECTGDKIQHRAGTRPVALLVCKGEDFHWMRANPDGTWSAKIPNKPVIRMAFRNAASLRDAGRINASRQSAPYKFAAFFNVPSALPIPIDTIQAHAARLEETAPELGQVWRQGLNTLSLSGKRSLLVSGCG